MHLISSRFKTTIYITEHTKKRLIERSMDEALLFDLIETGDIKFKDSHHAWIAKHYSNRQDNLLCAAIVIEKTLIVKTVMHHFSFKE
jgi:hypothetical protein